MEPVLLSWFIPAPAVRVSWIVPAGTTAAAAAAVSAGGTPAAFVLPSAALPDPGDLAAIFNSA